MFENDTIAAISTGMSSGGIGIIRISGNQAFFVIDSIFRGKDSLLQDCESHTIHYGHIYDDNKILDEVMVSIFRAPRTYTREDVVEINCHGGLLILRKIFSLVLAQGVRPAQPGEFTKRAFLNGRIDLSQAESVMDLISSKNEFALQNSLHQLSGFLSDKIKAIRNHLIYEIAYIESALDDPEHISLDGFDEHLSDMLVPMTDSLHKLSDSFCDGMHMKDGIYTVIAGKPNVGKSSLLNALAKTDRAIVTNVPGTTRDTLEEQITIDGITLCLVDTAGIHSTEDEVEKMGVIRSLEGLQNAEFILFVVDSSCPLDDNDFDIIQKCKNRNVIVLLNKSDLTPVITCSDISSLIDAPVVLFSAKEQDGLDDLSKQIQKMFFHNTFSLSDELVITNERQKFYIDSALLSLTHVIESIQSQMPEDFLTIDLMDAYENLGCILGEAVEDDLVDQIFSKFCMGK